MQVLNLNFAKRLEKNEKIYYNKGKLDVFSAENEFLDIQKFIIDHFTRNEKEKIYENLSAAFT